MRDYSFGNFISALRVRRGLSQYQLGALVGVSDKAVSKWENGVSKPRMNTIVKLAEVLDIGTDELLACKYDTFNHKRKDLFAMDEKIISKAELKMKEMYGVVLLYTEGMAICEDDWENLWCAEMPEEFVTAGDGIEIDGLTPLEDLPMEQQVRIKNELAALPEEYLDVLRNYGGGEE